jgi:hypothetical protein
VTSLDKVFVVITHNTTRTWVRADQIVSIMQTTDKILVKVAYTDLWIESDEPATAIFNRIAELANQ